MQLLLIVIILLLGGDADFNKFAGEIGPLLGGGMEQTLKEAGEIAQAVKLFGGEPVQKAGDNGLPLRPVMGIADGAALAALSGAI